MRVFKWLLLALAVAAGATLGAAEEPKASPSPKPTASPSPAAPSGGPFGALKFRYIGPEGNRVSAVAGVAGDPSVYYAGAASGGIFKSTDGGVHWQAIFDDQPVSSIGALAVAPSDPERGLGGHGRGVHPQQHLARLGRVPLHRRRPHLDARRSRGDGPDRPHRRRSARSRRRAGLRAGHAYGPQPDRGVFRTSDGGKTWAKTLFVDEKTGCSDLVMDPNNPRVLFAGMWQLEIHTWGRESGGPGSGMYRSSDGGAHLEAGRRQRPAPEAVGQGRPGDDARELGPRLRAHRGRRRPAVEGERHAHRPPLALGRRGREVGADDRRPAGRGPHALLQPHGRRARRSGRGVLPDRGLGEDARRRQDDHRPAGARRAGRRPPRHLDRSRQRQPHRRQPRRRRLDQHQPREDLAADPAPDRADLPRDRGRPDPVLGLRQPAGRAVEPRPEQQQARCPGRPAQHHARHVDERGRRRERLGDAGSRGPEHRLVERFGLRQRRRDRHALRRAHQHRARGRGLAAGDDRLAGGGSEVPLRVDVPAHDLAPRPQPHLRRQPVRPPDDRRRRYLAGDQPRPHAQRQVAAAELGRPHPRQHRRRVRGRGVRDRGVASEGGADLGGHQRRPAPRHAGRRPELDERDGAPAGPARRGAR